MFVSLRPVELTDDCRQIHSNIHQILLTQIVKCFIEYGIVDIKLADQSVAARFQVFTFYLVWVSFYLHKSHTTSFSFTLLVDEIKIWNGSHSVNRCHSSIQTSICTLIRFFSFQIWWIPSICRPHACRGRRGEGERGEEGLCPWRMGGVARGGASCEPADGRWDEQTKVEGRLCPFRKAEGGGAESGGGARDGFHDIQLSDADICYHNLRLNVS